MSAHEQMEQAEHAEHAAHSNKGIALLISVLALFLALSETLCKSAQTEGISFNVEASNLWAFYQAKTIRQTSLVVAADALTVTLPTITDPALKQATTKQIEAWKATAARYESEPKPTGGEGRRELSARAIKAQEERDLALAKYHRHRACIGHDHHRPDGVGIRRWRARGGRIDRDGLRLVRAERAARRRALVFARQRRPLRRALETCRVGRLLERRCRFTNMTLDST